MLSLRDGLTPANRWAVFDVGTASDETGPVADGDWTDVYIYNYGNANADVSWVVGPLVPVETGVYTAIAGFILPLKWKARMSTACHLRLHSSQPIVVAAYRGRGASRMALICAPIPTTGGTP